MSGVRRGELGSRSATTAGVKPRSTSTSRACVITSATSATSEASSAGRTMTSAPACLPSAAISPPSVETTIRSKRPAASAQRIASVVRLTPSIRRRFLSGTPLLPARAGTSASDGSLGISQTLLDADLGGREDIGDPLAREAVAEQHRALVASVRDLSPGGRLDLGSVVGDVDDVRPVLPPLLPRPDVHRRHAEERALAERGARVADHARGIVDEPRPVLDREVPVVVELLGRGLGAA